MRTKNIIWIIFALIIGAAIFWWTSIKKTVVRKAITNAVQKKTDSLYKITYDTSEIDEVSGDAYLRNVQIKLDSLQWLKLVQKDSIPPVTISLTIAKITIKGLAQLKLLSNHAIDVSSIIIENPVLRLDKWARKQQPAEALNDTLEIYKRLVGNLDFLKAKNIQVINGDVTFMNRLQKDSISVKGINIDIDNFLVDSGHNYRNILSYFIKQTRATINTVRSTSLETGRIVYDSKQRIITIKNLSTGKKTVDPVFVRSIDITGLSTEDFIYQGKINAKKIVMDHSNIVIGPSQNKGTALPAVISAGAVDSFFFQKGNITIHSKKGPTVTIQDADILLKNVHTVNGQLPLEEYFNPNQCVFRIGTVKFPLGYHSISLKQIVYPGKVDRLKIAQVLVKPMLSREQFKTKIGRQGDMYDVTANNIIVEKMDLAKFLKDNSVIIQAITLQVNFHIFTDKTLPENTNKKSTGKFFYEDLLATPRAIYIHTVNVEKSNVAYEEKAGKSGMTGTIFFNDIDAQLNNVTNIPEHLLKDNVMKLQSSTRIMGIVPLRSLWNMSLGTTDGSFRVTGNVGAFMPVVMNPVIEPLGMATVRTGSVSQLDFEINGKHGESKGIVLLNYDDLRIDLLKKDKEDSLKKKAIISFLTNTDIKNKYHSQKPKEYHFNKSDMPFFALLWESVYEGAKNIILIVKKPLILF